MAQENPTWGQARVAAELSVKLGIYVFSRTVRVYWPPEPKRRGNGRTCSQNWRTFVSNHAQSIVTCDFLVVATTRFRTLYVFLMMEVGTRHIVHCNVTAHPPATRTLQQLRETIPSDHSICNETYELGEELLGSYWHQVDLLHWLESNVHGFSVRQTIYI